MNKLNNTPSLDVNDKTMDASIDRVISRVRAYLESVGHSFTNCERLLRQCIAVTILIAEQETVLRTRTILVPERAHPDDRGERGYVRIPPKTKSATYQSLERALHYAAIDACIEPYLMAQYMTFFLERVADEIAVGNRVAIPGFGQFAAVWMDSGRRPGYAQPRFYPARTFRHQTDLYCDEAHARQNGPKMLSYRRSHHLSSSRRGKVGTVQTAMRRLRASLKQDGGILLPAD